MTSDEFKDIRDRLPSLPGVYKYLNAEQEIIYIGKAKDLKKRVSSYFTKNDHSYKTRRLIHLIRFIEFVIVNTEQDAFLLENSLIKKYQPRYNIMLKDDKTYPFICIKKEPFPRVFFTRKIIQDGSEYLGPYTSVYNAKIVLEMLQEIFPLRTCNLQLSIRNIQAKKFSVCLEYHLKNCLGPCEGLQSEEDYNDNLEQIRNILKSNFGTVKNFLKQKMNQYAERMEFEKAEEFRKKIDILSGYESRSTIVNPRLTDIDVYGFSETETIAFISYLKILNGTIIKTRAFEVKKIFNESREEILQRAVSEHSMQPGQNPVEILLPFDIEFPLEHIKLIVPQIGDKKKLVDMATKNALYLREEKLRQSLSPEEKKPSFRIMKKLKDDLKLKDLPVHIECFDNSNFQGTNPVSSCIVFRNAQPYKKDYRIFNVKTVEGANDFDTMQEVISRRYHRLIDEGQPLPQLIIVDGGKGQLSSAVESLNKLGLYGKIPIIGIAKKLEEIYFPEDSLPLYLNKKSESLKLIQRMRDEAHRFGITHHRKRRSKLSLHSDLTSIDGIGTKTFELLMKKFKSIAKLKETPYDQIRDLVGDKRATLLMEGLKNIGDNN